MDLSEIRQEIDSVDSQIVELYKKRMGLALEVARYKIDNNKPILDSSREKEKIEKAKAMVSDNFDKEAVADLFRQIMASSRKLQYRFMEDNANTAREDYDEMNEIDKEHAKVVYQGVEGAYSFLAMKQYFGENVDCFNVATFTEAMEAVAKGEADYAVLPIENSTAGIVNDTYDLLCEYDNFIVDKIYYKIDHALLGLENADISDIDVVYSHPQGLMQCSKYLDTHSDWQRIGQANTALSAKKVLEDGNVNEAAIASKDAAKYFSLKVLDTDISNNSNNVTRFVVISNKRCFRKNAGKMSICFETAHETGSLYNLLSHIIYNGLNMTKIESRPIEGKMWQWRFYVDFDGNIDDAAVKNAMRGIEEEAKRLKFLGNY